MTTQKSEVARMGAFNQDDEGLVRYLGLDPRKPEDRAAVAVCRHYGFDPLLKHVVVIPRSGVYITRDGLLNVAHRSGQRLQHFPANVLLRRGVADRDDRVSGDRRNNQ